LRKQRRKKQKGIPYLLSPPALSSKKPGEDSGSQQNSQ